MAVVFRTTGDWGAGLGRVLTGAEVDNNFWSLLQRIVALETTPPTPVSIESIDYEGGGITINLNDTTSYGPFPLPVAAFTYRGFWTNGTTYNYLDIFTVGTVGLFLVNETHTTPAEPAEFDAEALNGDSSANLYQQLSGVPREIAYDMGMNVIGAIPNDGGALQIFLADRAMLLPQDLEGSRAYLLTAAADAPIVLPIEHNGDEVGSLTFTPGVDVDDTFGQPGVFSFPSAITLAAGDRLVVRAFTGTADSEASDLVVTIAGTRADL